jgi:soluble methane monooxygenase-binding protein MmoD
MNDAGEDFEAIEREMKRFEASADWVPIEQRGSYASYAKDLDYMWHWILVKDGEIIQEGCSISFHTTKRSVENVMEFFASRNLSAIG